MGSESLILRVGILALARYYAVAPTLVRCKPLGDSEASPRHIRWASHNVWNKSIDAAGRDPAFCPVKIFRECDDHGVLGRDAGFFQRVHTQRVGFLSLKTVPRTRTKNPRAQRFDDRARGLGLLESTAIVRFSRLPESASAPPVSLHKRWCGQLVLTVIGEKKIQRLLEEVILRVSQGPPDRILPRRKRPRLHPVIQGAANVAAWR